MELRNDGANGTPDGGGYAPVALFAYRRASHLEQVICSLRKNPEAGGTDLHVFCDGPRTDLQSNEVEEVRALARSIQGFRSVRVVERETNIGLAASIIQGVTSMLAVDSQVIVLEDDIVVSDGFLAYMNAGLRQYRDEVSVASIHAYCYPIDPKGLPEAFFIRGADCWGWATWRRAWAEFEADGRQLLEELASRRLQYRFDFDGSYPYVKMLEDQIAGRNDSWAIRWYASAFLRERLTLYPRTSLVENIGLDGSGTHCVATECLSAGRLGTIPTAWPEPKELCKGRDALIRHFRTQAGMGRFKVLWLRVLSLLRKGPYA